MCWMLTAHGMESYNGWQWQAHQLLGTASALRLVAQHEAWQSAAGKHSKACKAKPGVSARSVSPPCKHQSRGGDGMSCLDSQARHYSMSSAAIMELHAANHPAGPAQPRLACSVSLSLAAAKCSTRGTHSYVMSQVLTPVNAWPDNF